METDGLLPDRPGRCISPRPIGPTPFVVLALLATANTAPLIAARLFPWFDRPVDGGRKLRDGRPLLGASKTWRGIVAALAGTLVAGRLLGVRPVLAGQVALLSMLGDLCASFAKRRIGIALHGRSVVLDRVPEAALPLVLLKRLDLRRGERFAIVLAFALLEEPLSRVLHRLGLRDRPF